MIFWGYTKYELRVSLRSHKNEKCLSLSVALLMKTTCRFEHKFQIFEYISFHFYYFCFYFSFFLFPRKRKYKIVLDDKLLRPLKNTYFTGM